MEFLLFVAVIGLLIYGYRYESERRERKLAERLEKMRDPNMASVEVDVFISQAKVESQRLASRRDHSGW